MRGRMYVLFTEKGRETEHSVWTAGVYTYNTGSLIAFGSPWTYRGKEEVGDGSVAMTREEAAMRILLSHTGEDVEAVLAWGEKLYPNVYPTFIKDIPDLSSYTAWDVDVLWRREGEDGDGP